MYDEGPNGEPRERELELGLAADRGEGPTFKVTRLDRSGDIGDEEMWRTTGPNFEFAFQAVFGLLPAVHHLALALRATGQSAP